MRASVAVGLLLAGCVSSSPRSDAGEAASALEIGGRQQVGGGEVLAWSRRGLDGALEVGVTLPRALIENPPAKGSGPAGALAVVPFPKQVQESTFFDHFELHWEAHGHPPPQFSAPHFDFHFYALNPEQVRQITSPEASPPSPDRLPPGYLFLGAEGFVPEMGTHAILPSALEQPFELVMVQGIVDGQLAFVEPMAPQAWLLGGPTRTLEVLAPATLGRATLFPRAFVLRYLPQASTYELVFSKFEQRD